MSIECRPSNVCSDVRCPSCGQGFLVYSDGRTATTEREAIRSTVQQELRRQHETHDHARGGFTLDIPFASTAALAC